MPGRWRFSVIFLVTDRCNLNCPYCFLADRRSAANVPLERFREIIQRHRPLYLQLTGGEPTVHPQFEEMVRWCVRRPMLTQFVTNGRGALPRIRFFEELRIRPLTAFSLDAAAPAVHDRIRGRRGLFDEIMEGVRFLRAIRAPAALSAVVFGPGQVSTLPEGNLDQVRPLVRLARRLRLSIGIQPMNPSPLEVRRALARELKRLRSPQVAGSPAFVRLLESPAPGPCLYNLTHVSYGADGEALPTSPGDCYFSDDCDDCFYACVREPSVVFEGALLESAAHFARLSLRTLPGALRTPPLHSRA
ncbi:MAG: radical SAM protein [bacterium]